MPWTSLCDLDELKPDEGKYVEIDGFQLAVFLSDGKVSAMDNRCPHAGGNLAGGHVADGCRSAHGTTGPSASITAN